MAPGKYWFKLKRIDYEIHTRTGDWGTDSKVELQILQEKGGKWEIISAGLTEPGDTTRLDAGTKQKFSRAFDEPIEIGASNDYYLYKTILRFRFKIHGDDAWSPARIEITPTFLINSDHGIEPIWMDLSETWVYHADDWILSTDPADGEGKKVYTTLTLRGPLKW